MIHTITIDELPPGWLGKIHAMYQGYKISESEWLLFTDADVLISPETLEKAIHYWTSNNTDHLVVLPDIRSRSEILNSIYACFQVFFHLKYKPWVAEDPYSEAYIGIGAFNLIKRSVYESIVRTSRLLCTQMMTFNWEKKLRKPGLASPCYMEKDM